MLRNLCLIASLATFLLAAPTAAAREVAADADLHAERTIDQTLVLESSGAIAFRHEVRVLAHVSLDAEASAAVRAPDADATKHAFYQIVRTTREGTEDLRDRTLADARGRYADARDSALATYAEARQDASTKLRETQARAAQLRADAEDELAARRAFVDTAVATTHDRVADEIASRGAYVEDYAGELVAWTEDVKAWSADTQAWTKTQACGRVSCEIPTLPSPSSGPIEGPLTIEEGYATVRTGTPSPPGASVQVRDGGVTADASLLGIKAEGALRASLKP